MDWFLDGFRPVEWPESFTGADMLNRRNALGLSVEEMALVLDAEEETIIKWESDDRGPPPLVRQIVLWLGGVHRPPNWPAPKGKPQEGDLSD